jgi:hypothetical protein
MAGERHAAPAGTSTGGYGAPLWSVRFTAGTAGRMRPGAV